MRKAMFTISAPESLAQRHEAPHQQRNAPQSFRFHVTGELTIRCPP